MAVGTVTDRGAGQTIIEERYTRLARQRRLIGILNSAAVFSAICFMTGQMVANSAILGDARLNNKELFSVCVEIAAWLCVVAGLGFGKAAREKLWLLRVGQLLAAFSIVAHVLALNPERLKEIGVIMEVEKPEMVDYYRQGAVVAQAFSVLIRMAMVYSGKAYLDDKKAAPNTAAKKRN